MRHLWQNNPALTQLLGLCPLLAVTQTIAQAIGLGLATLFVLLGSSAAVSIVRGYIPEHLRLPAFVMIIASLTTCAMLIMAAMAFTLYQSIALFVQIIVTNCLILSQIESFASRHSLLVTLVDALTTGLGFMLALVLLGGLREIIAYGSIGSGLQLLFGEGASGWQWQLITNYDGLLLAALPPGAFIGLGCLIALKNYLANRYSKVPVPHERQ